MKTRPCPHCAEDIAVAAKTCRFCGETVRLARPGARAGIRWEGTKLIVPKLARIRMSFCWICASRRGVAPYARTFSYAPDWAHVSHFLALAMQQKVELHLPLCRRCRSKWIRSRAAFVGSFVLCFFGAMGGLLLGGALAKDDGLLPGMVCGVLAGLVVAGIVKLQLVNKRQIFSEIIENDEVTLLLPRPGIVQDAFAEDAENDEES